MARLAYDCLPRTLSSPTVPELRTDFSFELPAFRDLDGYMLHISAALRRAAEANASLVLCRLRENPAFVCVTYAEGSGSTLTAFLDCLNKSLLFFSFVVPLEDTLSLLDCVLDVHPVFNLARAAVLKAHELHVYLEKVGVAGAMAEARRYFQDPANAAALLHEVQVSLEKSTEFRVFYGACVRGVRLDDITPVLRACKGELASRDMLRLSKALVHMCRNIENEALAWRMRKTTVALIYFAKIVEHRLREPVGA